jgi:hypothetical protein
MTRIMSSSTSSSESGPSGSESGSARKFLGTFIFLAFGLAIAALAALTALDPYDTGRLTPWPRAGVPETAPRMANASRLRDPAFDAAIVGNSTIQLISPERLKGLIRHRFVQLSIPGTGPVEQAAVARALFRRRGEGVATLVIGLDAVWCDAAYDDRPVHPFPFWLYDPSRLIYLKGLFRWGSVEFLPRRVGFLFGRAAPARPDGYWDYDQPRSGWTLIGPSTSAPPVPAPVRGQYAAIRSLASLLAATPASTRIVLLHPPVHSAATEQSAAEVGNLTRCKGALREAVNSRPDAIWLDFWVDNEANRNPANFLDHHHYRKELAIGIEAAIAARLQR